MAEVRSHDVVFDPTHDSPGRFISLSLPFPCSLFAGRATYRADPLFLRATRVCYTMPLQVENTDRLGINRSRDTEEQQGEEGGRKKEEARG